MAVSTQWRVYITQNNGNSSYTGIAELEMAEEEGGPNLYIGGTAIFRNQQLNNPARKAFDGIKSDNGWMTAQNQPRPTWIGYQFRSEVQIREFRIWFNGRGGNEAPRDFELQYYDDNTSEWVSVDGASYTGETGWTAYEERVYAGDLSSGLIYTVRGRCVRGVANLPTHREIYAYSMFDGAYIGFAETDAYGDFTVNMYGTDAVFLRIVDPEGIYSTEIRENIIPIPNPEE